MSPPSPDTVCALLTGSGRGAIATVAVQGPQAAEVVASRFLPLARRPWLGEPVGRVSVGHWGSREGEELVVCRRACDLVEIHGHGGALASATIINSLVAAGCRSISAVEWLARQPLVPIERAATLALSRAPTRRAAGILLDQQQGALSQALRQIVALIGARQTTAAAQQIAVLLAFQQLGLHLVEPFRVVLAGPPNAGKSSLLNALVGHQRAIVSPTPGTTRDAVTSLTAIDGWPVELVDTAGLRTSDDTLEQAGMSLSQSNLDTADLRVLVFDRSRPWTSDDAVLATAWPDAVVVMNKSDLPADPQPRLRGIDVSARTGAELDTLIATLAARLVLAPPAVGAAVPFTAEQFAAIGAVATALERDDFQQAVTVIEQLLADS
ncbi:MAG: 50S ribosome-binding GTPase [Planctomycetes bacterium]|nr:50S ribosome-binding GTPase [Planctomycetota bacterium]